MPRTRLRLLLFFWAIIAVLYIPAWRGGFGQDFLGWLQLYYDDSFWDCINRRGSGIKSFYQVTQLQLYFWTALFGTHAMPWFLLFTGLHALNGMLLCRLCTRIFGDFDLPHPARTALVGTALFLIAPSMTEVTVWKACYHYLTGFQALLWCLIWCRQYALSGDRRWAFYTLLLFAFATATLETWYLILPSVFVLLLAYGWAGIIDRRVARRSISTFCLPMLAMLAGHLLLYHSVYGYWLPHSAFRTPGPGPSALQMAARFWSYEAHLIGFGRFFPNGARFPFYDHVGSTAAGGVAAILFVCTLMVWGLMRFSKGGPRFRLAMLFGAWALGSLVIVLHYEPERLFRINNDRYLYFTGAFQYIIIALLLPCGRRAFRLSAALALLLNLAATVLLVRQWRQGTKIFWGIQDAYKWKDAPAVILLNLPATYNGVGIINTARPSDLPEHLRIFYRHPPRQNVHDVAGYNMAKEWDGAHVTVLDAARMRVTLNQWGTWWQWAGYGASDFETPMFSVHFTDPGHEYEISLKEPALQPGVVILYQQGRQWRIVDMAKSGEQW